MDVGEGLDADGVVFGVAAKAERIGERRFAFEDQDGTVFDAGGPVWARRRSGACDEDASERWRAQTGPPASKTVPS